MNVVPSIENDVCTLLVEGDIDTITAPELEKAVAENATGCKKLVFDFSGVKYVSSAGIRVVLMASKQVGKDNFSMKNLKENVLQVFNITGFSKLLNIE